MEIPVQGLSKEDLVLDLRNCWLGIAMEKYEPNVDGLSEFSREGINLYF